MLEVKLTCVYGCKSPEVAETGTEHIVGSPTGRYIVNISMMTNLVTF